MSVDKMLKRHEALTHSENLKVISHVQREDGEWVRHTIMIENVDAPFVFKRTKQYKSLVGARVNMTYYRAVENVAGMAFEQMKVVRIKRA